MHPENVLLGPENDWSMKANIFFSLVTEGSLKQGKPSNKRMLLEMPFIEGKLTSIWLHWNSCPVYYSPMLLDLSEDDIKSFIDSDTTLIRKLRTFP